MQELYFRLGPMKGFTAIELADKRTGYATPIRELLQNSLDACREMGHDQKCEINIHLETIPRSKIPHIDRYEKVLNQAIETHKQGSSFNANTKRAVGFIQDALKKQHLDILMFADNGIGLSPKRMNAIMTGASVHDDDEKSGGSFGVGHLTSYALSSLRYVLYATKYKTSDGNTKKLFTGSPILAGYHDGQAQRGNRGTIVAQKPSDENDPEFLYPDEFPDFIDTKMDAVDNGTIVVVLGLNQDWNDEAEYATVSNFFHAINHDVLSIKIHSGNNPPEVIDDATVERLIFERKEGRRAMGDSILSGRAVYQAWEAVHGAPHLISLSNGDKVYAYINTDPTAESTIVLIRNGMVIARHDSMLSGDMNKLRKNPDFDNFTAVIDVDKADAPKLFDLVKGAEGPYHNELVKDQLTRPEESNLKVLFKELGAEIESYLKPVERDSFDLPLFTIPNEDAEQGGGYMRSGQNKQAQSRRKAKPPKPKPPQSDPGKPKREVPKVVTRNLNSKNAVRYTDNGAVWIVHLRVLPQQQPDSRDEVYLSFCLGEDNDKDIAATYLDFVKATLNGASVDIPKNKSQVKLGEVQKSQQYDIIAEMKKPNWLGDTKVSLLPILGLGRESTKKE